MNTPVTTKTEFAPQTGGHLLETIQAIRERVGDGLIDDEFTRLLQKAGLPVELGFSFLSYCDGFVTLHVPPQESAGWYSENGRLAAAKEQAARKIAGKFGLSVCEPPDLKFAWGRSPHPHHHLELCGKNETIIVIHPEYLKVRLFVAASSTFSARAARKPLILSPELLPDLAALYRT